MLHLSSFALDRERIMIKYGIDIFDCVINGEKTVAKLKRETNYWVDLCHKLSESCKEKIRDMDISSDTQSSLDDFMNNPEIFEERQELKEDIDYYNKIARRLSRHELIIDLPKYSDLK